MISQTHRRHILPRPRRLNIRQRLLQVLQLGIHLPLGRLRALDSLDLEGLDRLDLPTHIVRLRLELLELGLDLVDNGAVLERVPVGCKVHGRGLGGELIELAAGVVVAFLEGLEGGGGLALEPEGGGDFGPVDLHCCGALERVDESVWAHSACFVFA